MTLQNSLTYVKWPKFHDIFSKFPGFSSLNWRKILFFPDMWQPCIYVQFFFTEIKQSHFLHVSYTHVVCCVSLTLTSSRCSDTCDVIGATVRDWEGRGTTASPVSESEAKNETSNKSNWQFLLVRTFGFE